MSVQCSNLLGHKDSLIIQTIRRSVMTQYKSRKQRVTFTVEHSVQYPLEGEH
ncbi:hypothetical protein [Isorropodon fossajaponicum symbiont]|uniref:hypothetical protein n=1 Tax=Isorropodon fossajaponicum symbiont TaxID=883811 RepID=UPI00191527EE|nr:hypothetical protein [Isorropodon fossajaponicum symbiont]